MDRQELMDQAIAYYEKSLDEDKQLGKAYTDLLKLYNLKRQEAAAAKDDANLVGTELNKSYIEVVGKTFTADDVTPLTSLRKLLGPANEKIAQIVTEKATLFKL